MFPYQSSVVNKTPNKSTQENQEIGKILGCIYVYKQIFFFTCEHITAQNCLTVQCQKQLQPTHDTCLDMFAVMASGWQLDPPEGDRTFQGDLDGCLLNAVLSIQCSVPGGCRYTAEVPLD